MKHTKKTTRWLAGWPIWVVCTVCTMVMASGIASAQTSGSTPSPTAMPIGAPEMLANFVTSWLLPVVVIPFILQSHWTETRKRIWSVSICFVVALFTTIVNQKYSFQLIPGATFADQIGNFGSWFLFNSTVILGATKILFTNFWRDTGLPDKIEAATSRKPTDLQKLEKRLDQAQSVIKGLDVLSWLKNTTPDTMSGVLPTAPPATQSNIIPPAPPTLEPFPDAENDEQAQQLFATILPDGGDV